MLGNTNLAEGELVELINNSVACDAVFMLVDNNNNITIMLRSEDGTMYSGLMPLTQFKDYVQPILAMVQ